ncbi:MAG TPA: anti-sigma factor [Acidimicrobiia bacterium]|jgi:anti-sigma-K factor RskA|nr:anti-sigma factor [Acidimicrobiia bacterium]
MSDARDHSVDDLLAAFALDAVEPEERARVERHLAVDPDARAEVDAMRETAAVLASVPREGQGASADLWDRIAAAIKTDDEAPERTAVEPIPITRTHGARSVPMRVFAPIAAAAAILVVVLAFAVANRAPSRVGDTAAAYRHAVAHGATTVALDTGAHAPVAEIALQSDGTGYLRNEHLAALPAGRTYQLWAVNGTGASQTAISAGVLGPDPSAVAFHVASAPDAFAITVEQAPGVVQSTQQPAAVGEVNA